MTRKHGPPKGYADLANLPEDARIDVIVDAINRGHSIAIGIEADDPEKQERYVRKVLERCPRAEHTGTNVLGSGAYSSVVIVGFKPKPDH